MAPEGRVEVEFPDGVVMDRAFVERTGPNALHSEDTMSEDDNCLDLGFEVWDYEVVDGHQDEFLAALKNSEMAIECVRLDDASEPL